MPTLANDSGTDPGGVDGVAIFVLMYVMLVL